MRLLLIVLMVPAAAHAKRFGFVVQSQTSLKQQIGGDASFVKARMFASNQLMDRGRLLYLGNGHATQWRTFHFLEVAQGKRVTRTLPASRKHPTLRQAQLLFYDSASQQAGVLARERVRGVGAKFYYGAWSLKSDSVRYTALASTKRGSYYAAIPIGFDREHAVHYTLFYQGWIRRRIKQGPDRPHEATIVALNGGGARTIVPALLLNPAGMPRVFFDRTKRRALVAEYGQAGSNPQPKGWLIDLTTGKDKTVAVPRANYAAVFAPNDQALLYGSQAGVIWRISLASGKRLTTSKIGSLGWALGYDERGDLLFIDRRAITRIDPKRLRKRQRFRLSRVARGIRRVEGSFVTPSHVVLVTKDSLRLLRRR